MGRNMGVIALLIPGLWFLNSRFLAFVLTDGWWLACHARALFETGHMPRQVLGSFALEGYAYHHPAWLYGIWAYIWLTLGGPWLWIWMDGMVLGVLAGLAMWKILSRDGLDLWTRSVLIGWAGSLFWPSQTLRGLIWGVVLFLWLLRWIQDVLKNTDFPSATFWRFPLIAFLWASLHGGFFLPLSMMLLTFLFRPSRKLALVLVFAVLATFLHPYAPQNWIDHILILRHPPTFIKEWISYPQMVHLLSRETGEPGILVGGVVLLPYLLALIPLFIPASHTRWSLFLSTLVVGATVASLGHIRHLVWAGNAGLLLLGNRLGARSFRLPRGLLFFHLFLALAGWSLRLPSLVSTGYTAQEETREFLDHLATLPPGRIFASLQIANALCWLNPGLSQWIYGIFQMGVARNETEWERITRDVVRPLQLVNQGGEEALKFFAQHRVIYALLEQEGDARLIRTLQKAGCQEEKRGLSYTLFLLRDCLEPPIP